MADTVAADGGEYGGTVNTETSSSGSSDSGGSSSSMISGFVSSSTTMADTINSNMSAASATLNQAKLAKQTRKEDANRAAEERSRYEDSRRASDRELGSNMADAMLGRYQTIDAMRKQVVSDKNQARFGKALLKGMAMGMGLLPFSDGSMMPRPQSPGAPLPRTPTQPAASAPTAQIPTIAGRAYAQG